MSVFKTLGIAAGAAAIAASMVPASASDLTFWSWRQEDKSQYEKYITMFEKDHPDTHIKFKAYEADNYATILSTALAGDQGPDLMMVRAYGAFESVAGPGYLMDLDSKIPALDTFPKAAIKAETLRSDGKVYAVPFASQTMLVMYNKAVFKKNGIEPPKTWDDLMADCKKLKQAGIYPFANGTATAWQNETIVFALGSSIMGKGFYDDLQAGKATFEDPRFVEALAKLDAVKKYFPNGFTGIDYPSSQQLFASGMAGMFAGGSFEIANFKQQNPKLDIGVFPAPPEKTGKDALVSVFYDGGYAANAKTEHPKEALEFLKFLASKKFGQAFANGLGNVSPVPGVQFKSPLLSRIADLNTTSIPYVMLVDFRYEKPSGSVVLQQQIQKMMAGKATPKEVGAKLTKDLATYYKPFQNQ
ncbi:extracellular solute-binding protein [Pararhizobium mangrovi]|uniref:Extracellular solute-binding protein n=1 Tax=Pararhizobium mangrovi TaxID=2590452 RepID=A0A506TW73_9HYPH|nr:extracellular solute-binding protein [Pararhizobium mangrovi]TPW26322.1 extracellular solute-binding protein [Pararhizobium mangrovi]